MDKSNFKEDGTLIKYGNSIGRSGLPLILSDLQDLYNRLYFATEDIDNKIYGLEGNVKKDKNNYSSEYEFEHTLVGEALQLISMCRNLAIKNIKNSDRLSKII